MGLPPALLRGRFPLDLLVDPLVAPYLACFIAGVYGFFVALRLLGRAPKGPRGLPGVRIVGGTLCGSAALLTWPLLTFLQPGVGSPSHLWSIALLAAMVVAGIALGIRGARTG
jgi:hypothetical protein